jgi:ABC-type phosphate transport system permease subunit
MALTLLIVLVFTATVLLATGRWVAAIVLAVLALPVLVVALRRMRRESRQ